MHLGSRPEFARNDSQTWGELVCFLTGRRGEEEIRHTDLTNFSAAIVGWLDLQGGCGRVCAFMKNFGLRRDGERLL